MHFKIFYYRLLFCVINLLCFYIKSVIFHDILNLPESYAIFLKPLLQGWHLCIYQSVENMIASQLIYRIVTDQYPSIINLLWSD